ncbi:hypothetical protein D6777_00450 [Candidatus Woesearchaeota archaeon]|nr:MAG: hypothetical protein D6777_00450 [Candidatus Woesearchaeota archaeon]
MEEKMIEFESDKLKEKVGQYTTKIRQYTDSLRGIHSRTQQTLQQGVQQCTRLESLVGEVGARIEKAKDSLANVGELSERKAKKVKVSDLRKRHSLALELVADERVRDRGSFLDRIPFFKKTMPMTDALAKVSQGISQLPEYVGESLEEVQKTYEDINNFKTQLRGEVERVVEWRQGLEGVKQNIERDLDALEAEYKSLENKREQAVKAQKPFDRDEFARLTQLQTLIGQYRDTYSTLKLEEEEGDGLIEVIQNQIRKMDEFQDLVSGAITTMKKGKMYVDFQVPYAVQEIKGQQSLTTGLMAVNKAVQFLERQTEVAQAYNELLANAVVGLNSNVEALKATVCTEYILPGGRTLSDYQQALAPPTTQELTEGDAENYVIDVKPLESDQ